MLHDIFLFNGLIVKCTINSNNILILFCFNQISSLYL